MLTADCVPILLFDYQNNIIGCIHAGWKGALNGIIENTIKKIKKIIQPIKSLHVLVLVLEKKVMRLIKDFLIDLY